MIQVQIASQITRDGVDGIRWVLVDAAEAADSPYAATTAADAAAQPPPPQAGADVRNQWSLALLKLLVLVVALGAAVWVARAWLGPARGPWNSPATPGAQQPARAAPPQGLPASRTAPSLTAGL